MNFHLSCGLSQSAYQGGVLPGQRAPTEHAISLCDHLAKRQGHSSQVAEQSVELRHQHTGGHALAGDVAQHKEELSIGRDQVAVVATAGTERGVRTACVPTTWLWVH